MQHLSWLHTIQSSIKLWLEAVATEQYVWHLCQGPKLSISNNYHHSFQMRRTLLQNYLNLTEIAQYGQMEMGYSPCDILLSVIRDSMANKNAYNFFQFDRWIAHKNVQFTCLRIYYENGERNGKLNRAAKHQTQHHTSQTI